MKKYKVIWDELAKESLKSILAYIKKESPSGAEKVKNVLLKLTSGLDEMPERFSEEIYLSDKMGNYRSLSKWSYKIIYKITDTEVQILDIFHTRMDPSEIEGLE